MTDILAPHMGLAETAYASLTRWFHEIGQQPSENQWDALRDLLNCLERAANGGLDQSTYVSAIPAGCGKTSALCSFAEALMTNPAYSQTGMMIAANRVTEVADIAAKLAGFRDRLCIVVGSKNVSTLAMGAHVAADQAQIVVTTQAALKATLKASQDFPAASRYWFKCQRRAVVCWDEALTFNRPVTLDNDAILGLAHAVRVQSPEAATTLKEWSAALDRAPAGEIDVPDFASLGLDFRRLEEDVGERDDLVSQAKALTVISGGTGWVLRDNLSGGTLISHVPELPSSLLPVIVTDASAAPGVHHAGYTQMALTRSVTHLKEATKTYENLTLRLVPTAASRSTYKDQSAPKGLELIEMAVRYVRSVSPNQVLIVSYKSWMKMRGVQERTIREAITARLTATERARVSHLCWGTHTATNDHKDTRHVLLMGLNFMPRAASHAASGAALDKPMRSSDPTDHPTNDQVEAMRTGMLRDSTLQAILRGHARMGRNGDCGECEVVVPQTRQTGLSDQDWRGMFPGVRIEVDRVLMPQKPLRGNLKLLSQIVARRLGDEETEMTNPSLYEEMGMTRSNFGKLVKRPEWKDWVAAVGLRPQELKGRVKGLRRVA